MPFWVCFSIDPARIKANNNFLLLPVYFYGEASIAVAA